MMPRIAPLAAVALLATACATAQDPSQPAPYWTAPPALGARPTDGDRQVAGGKAPTGRGPSVATAPRGSADG